MAALPRLAGGEAELDEGVEVVAGGVGVQPQRRRDVLHAERAVRGAQHVEHPAAGAARHGPRIREPGFAHNH